MTVATGYNLGAIFVGLFNQFHQAQGEKQQNIAKEVKVWNEHLALLAELKGHITKSLAFGDKIISLPQKRDLIDRISFLAKTLKRPDNLLLFNKVYTLESRDIAKSQLDLIDEESQHGAQEINLLLTRMTQFEKDTSEAHKITSDLLKQDAEQQKNMLKKI